MSNIPSSRNIIQQEVQEHSTILNNTKLPLPSPYLHPKNKNQAIDTKINKISSNMNKKLNHSKYNTASTLSIVWGGRINQEF